MGRISIKANAVIALKDGFLDKPGISGTVAVFTHNGVYAKKKEGDIFVFSNLIKGLYRVTVESVYYKSCSFDLLVEDEMKVMDIPLYPSRNYRFDTVSTRLWGKLNLYAYVVLIPDARSLRLISPYTSGDRRIRLYGEYIPTVFSLYIQNQDRRLITSVAASEITNEYILDAPPDFDMDMESVILGLAFRVTGDGNGAYFLAVRGKYQKALFFAASDDMRVIKEASLSEGEQNIDIQEEKKWD